MLEDSLPSIPSTNEQGAKKPLACKPRLGRLLKQAQQSKPSRRKIHRLRRRRRLFPFSSQRKKLVVKAAFVIWLAIALGFVASYFACPLPRRFKDSFN